MYVLDSDIINDRLIVSFTIELGAKLRRKHGAT
nr:MAG TPA_asm: hypothetical protein [Caudoviricetes sp.]